MPRAKWRTGKTRATQVIHAGAFLPIGMKIPERKRSGRIAALTLAGAASALGMAAVIAKPSAVNERAPTVSTTRKRTRSAPVGMLAL